MDPLLELGKVGECPPTDPAALCASPRLSRTNLLAVLPPRLLSAETLTLTPSPEPRPPLRGTSTASQVAQARLTVRELPARPGAKQIEASSSLAGTGIEALGDADEVGPASVEMLGQRVKLRRRAREPAQIGCDQAITLGQQLKCPIQ